MSAIFVSVDSVRASACRPSRGATSTSVIRAASVIARMLGGALVARRISSRRGRAADTGQRPAARRARGPARARAILPRRTPRDDPIPCARSPGGARIPRARFRARARVCGGRRQPRAGARASRPREPAPLSRRREDPHAGSRRLPPRLMEFQDVIRKRKMVRSFEDRPVDHAIVERMLANAQKAPSAGFSQGWGFLVLEGKTQAQRYWDATWPTERRRDFGWPDMFNAPVIIVCLSNKDQYLTRYAMPDKGWTDRDEKRWPVPYWDIDTGMAALNILLTAVDAGLGAVFFGVFDQAKLRAAFGIPEDYTAVGTIAVGHPKPKDRPSPTLKNVGRRDGARGLQHARRWWTRGAHRRRSAD